MMASTGKRAANLARNAAILALYGKKSFALIALELDIERNIVAGVVFRANHPAGTRDGIGRHGRGPYAEQTLFRAGKPALAGTAP